MIDEAYVKKLEDEVERLEEKIEQFQRSYKVLAIACAKGHFQKSLVCNEITDGWAQPKHYGHKTFEQNFDSKKNLLQRLTEADVAHLRKIETKIRLEDKKSNKKEKLYIRTEYGPPPKDLKPKSYLGLPYYVY